MRWIVVFLFALLHVAAPVSAQGRWVVVEEWIEHGPADGTDRAMAFRAANTPTAIAAFGPFRVLDQRRAALVGVTDRDAPAHFAAMLARYPALERLELIDCPGTEDDRANLALGRMIRARGLTTHVPDGGSVRSGAVELFLAGARRELAPGARFAVHAWRDDRGREAGDYAADAPEHRAYLDYYAEMGMGEATARDFYAMTNAVGHAGARWLDAGEMRGWLAHGIARVEPPAPRLAYLDFARGEP